MGWAIHKKKRAADAEKHLKRLHKTTPLIESPLEGADYDSLVFSQRHEANTAELFFDLFFAANLATFTTYHSITDSSYLITYVGFFGILWSCWFNVTLHDVRFARDSLYERICKTVQFIAFVGLALVGSSFNPMSTQANNTNFRILCYTLVISRGLLAVQYGIVLVYIIRAKFSKLYLPLGLMVGLYVAVVGIFIAMTPAFQKKEATHSGIYVVWYIVMAIEAISVIAISSIWRMLSFKKTHLMERMSLLTLIVIGEGAIGVTKTVSRIMGKYGLEVEGCFLIMCIITVLVLIWALYFDNFPHGHYGTIRQQIWSLLHFPFQLAIVGVVEGSQQVALARYVIKNWEKIENSHTKYCLEENLDGSKLRDKLLSLVDYWDFTAKFETYAIQEYTTDIVYQIGNSTDICSATNVTTYSKSGDWPLEFVNMTQQLFDGVYIGLGMKLPVSKLEYETPQEIAIKSWKIVFVYYWASFCLLIACLLIFLVLIRRHRADVFDFVSIGSRAMALAVGAAMITLVANDGALYSFLRGPAVLPACLSLLFLVLFFDKLSAAFANHQLLKSGKPYALEHVEHHHDRSSSGSSHVEHGHVENVSDHHGHSDSLASHRKSATWSLSEDTIPLTQAVGGEDRGSYAMTPMMSPPILSPNQPVAGGVVHQNGYTPVQNYGA
ncbi:hypothetical protein CC80DRAFT_497674 [Byssothecium circinans]|uniref:Low temperature requirement A n=1 Tax=Byssothecium circinans TaxID=147558 RepID=A0A6A5T974_9PLEO|nr:hypothetical protein CC80DRAFT_497674 [Byssothecium circinans]